MKKNVFVFALFCLCPFLLVAESQREFDDWLPRMKEIFGDEQPTTSDISAIEVRELKYPGQRFQHMARTDIEGEGRSRKENSYWWPTEKRLTLQHETSFILLEEITSTEEELDEGIIKSRFTVQVFNERLKSAKGNMSFGPISSKDLLKCIKTFGENYGDQINVAADGKIAAGLCALLAPEPVVTKGAAISILADGATLKLGSWMLFEKLGEIHDEEGNVILSEQTVHKYFPECSKVIAKLRKLEGTVILTTWVPDKGYTQFEINFIPGLSQEDKELIAKNVFHFNPVGANSILPKDKKNKDDVWAIDVKKDFGGILTTTGVDYDSLGGNIWVKDCGIGTAHYDDETFLTKRPETDITTVRTANAYDNSITFYKGFKDHSYLRMNARPTGEIVVVTPQNGHTGARYVKSIDMKGKIQNHIDKPAGLLTDISFEENTISLHFVYIQLRIPDAKK